MLNNEERLEKIRNSATQLPPVMTQQENPLAFVMPTEFVILPSKGLYYAEGHPLYNKDSVEIKQMTTKEEDILTNKSLIKKGTVLDKLLESLLVDKSINPQTLLTGDRNAILLAARRTGYGDDYDIGVSCGTCSTKKSHTVNLTTFIDENLERLEKKIEGLDSNVVGRLQNGNIVIKLPKTEWLVECRPLNGKDELYLMNLAESKKKSSLSEEVTVVEQMLLMIVSIQLVSERSKVMEAISVMPATDAKFLRKMYQEASPSFDMKINYECPSCNNSQEVEVGFNQEFFWPK